MEARLSATLADIASAGHRDDDHVHSSLSRLLAQRDVFEELALINDTGQELYRVSRLTPGSSIELKSRADTDEFLIPMTRGEVYYSPVRFDQKSGEPLMTLAVPLIDARSATVYERTDRRYPSQEGLGLGSQYTRRRCG